MNKFLLFFALWCFIFTQKATAQITVNDPAFLAFLQQNYAGCMNGNQIIVNCPAITSTQTLNLSGLGISDLSGVEAFTGLTSADFSNNNISSLPQYFGLFAEGDGNLNLSNNQFSVFPYALGNMNGKQIDLSFNQISSFVIPSINLAFYNCEILLNNNQINSLTVQSSDVGLKLLDLGYNNVSELNLGYFWSTYPLVLLLNNNQISSIDPMQFSLSNPNVQKLDLSYNGLSTLPSYLWAFEFVDTLIISNNQFTTLPASAATAGFLDCSNNQMTSLTFLLEAGYQSLLYGLNCSNNNISGSWLSNYVTNEALQYIDCSNNEIACMPLLSPFLQYLDFSNNPVTCLSNIPPLLASQLQDFPVCELDPFINPNNCNVYMAVTADVFDDQNSNCLKDNNEESVYFGTIFLTNAQGDTINTVGSSMGSWILPYFGDGDFSAILDTINKPYQASCGAQNMGASQDFTVYPGQTSIYLNFPVECKPGFDVGAQGLFPDGWVFPGQTHTLTVMAGDMSEMYGLNCASGVAGTVNFTVNGPVSYVGPAPDALSPTSVSGLSFSYDIADFGNLNSWSDFAVLLETDTTAQAGDAICVSINVSPSAGDNNPSNNQFTQCYQVINSYDPNDKWVYPELVLPGYNDYLTYTINFQNTGNAPAFNIRLEDTLSSLLDLTSFEVVYFSHDMHYKIVNNKLTVYFPNIMLADSTTNEPESKGKLIYRVKPKSDMPIGTEIDNTCHIFFDFNAPIVTNTVTTLFDISASLPSYNYDWVLYPNPNKGSFSVSGGQYESIEIFDETGRMLDFHVEDHAEAARIHLVNAVAGIYFVRLMNGGQVVVKKVFID